MLAPLAFLVMALIGLVFAIKKGTRAAWVRILVGIAISLVLLLLFYRV